MTEVFPDIRVLSLADTEPGSAFLIPRARGYLLCLATSERDEKGIPSFVALSGESRVEQMPLFATKWQNVQNCLSLGVNLQWALSTEDHAVDPTGQSTWKIPGTIVVIGDRQFISCAPGSSFYDTYRLVDIRSGEVFSGDTPHRTWTFLAWKLFLKNIDPERSILLHEFDARLRIAER